MSRALRVQPAFISQARTGLPPCARPVYPGGIAGSPSCCTSTGILVGEHSAWGTLLFAAEKAAAAIKVIQDGRTTLLAGMTKEAAKEALRLGM